MVEFSLSDLNERALYFAKFAILNFAGSPLTSSNHRFSKYPLDLFPVRPHSTCTLMCSDLRSHRPVYKPQNCLSLYE